MKARLKAKQFTVPADKPFENDCLDRTACANVLTDLVTNSESPLILALNSPWGTGKTTFLEMWSRDLRNKGFATITFSAWENDFSDDALACLIGELQSLIDDLPSKSATRRKSQAALQKVKTIGAGLLKTSLPIMLKAATLGALDVRSEWETLWSELVEKNAVEQIQRYENAKKSLVSFKSAFRSFIEQGGSENNQASKGKLVIIIDELDRCRPNFAIEVLERIKHLFEVDGAFFVIAMDRKQLSHSVQAIYGEIDTNEYLRRFFDFEMSLPAGDAKQIVKSICSRFDITESLKWDARNETNPALLFQLTFGAFVRVKQLSLRQIERAIALYALALNSTPKRNAPYSNLLAILIVLKFTNEPLYNGFRSGAVSPDEVWEHFMKDPSLSVLKDKLWMIAARALLIVSDSDQQRCDNFRSSIIGRMRPDASTPNFQYNSELIQRMDEYTHEFGSSERDRLIRRIELLEALSVETTTPA